MPLYDFQSADGKVIQKTYPMSRAPKTIRVKGRRYRRILSANLQVTGGFKPYASIPSRKFLPGFPHDKRGRPIIQTRADEQRMAKLNGCEME